MTSLSLTMLVWIAATTVATWAFPRKSQPYVIAAFTAAFFLVHSPLSMGILTGLALVCYVPVMQRGRGWRVAIVGAGAVAGVLLWFKVRNGFDEPGAEYAVIPLGLSYYSLRLIHLAVDSWKGTLPPCTIGQYLCYLFFLPTVVAGPVNRFQEFHRSLRRRRWDAGMFSRGCERILYGCAWIIIFGNYIVSFKLNQWVANMAPAHPALSEYLGCACYGLNLFFQFSGYSHVAIGFALLLGFNVCENFNYPLLATNINEFWRRWHMSLSSWCRDYVYMPVLSLTRQPVPAVIASMVVLGLWHEISWRYLAWGAYHGVGIAVWQLFQKFKAGRPPLTGLTRVFATGLAWFLTMNFVLLSFAITKELTLAGALVAFRTIFHL